MSALEASMIKARNAEKRGDYAEAERLYGAVLERFPRNARARRGLDDLFKARAAGSLKGDAPPQALLDRLAEAYNQGQMTQVVLQAEALVGSHPRASAVHNLLGVAYLNLAQADRAAAALRRAVEGGIRYAPIFSNLAMALTRLDRFIDAEAAYREAIALDPRYAVAHNNLGNLLKNVGRPVEALAAYRDAVASQSDYPDAYNNMGRVLETLGRRDEAQIAYRRALALKPDHAAAHNNLGNVLSDLGDLTAALACYEKALAIQPDYADAHYNLGNIFRRQGRIAEANLAYQRAKAARPDYADAWAEEGKTLALAGRLDEAIHAFGEALSIEPDHAVALSHRLFYQAHVCDWSERDGWQRLGPDADSAFSPFTGLIFEDDPALQLRRSRNWAASRFPQPPASLDGPAPAADGRIRIGYFSADFHDHATLYLMAGLLRTHDRSRFAIHSFSYGPELGGAMRDQLLGHVDGFHAIGGMADAAVVDLARGLDLDIAVDLKGYTLNGRTQLFAHRLAPVQIGYLGYPGSSGTDFIDYLVADPAVVPEWERRHYSEKLLLLPDSYQPNDDARAIAPHAPDRASCGLPETGFVFCCFNHNYKIGPREFAIWMRLLGQVDGSVLWLLRSNPWAEDNLRREAAARGIAPERLIFADQLPHADHLARLRHADLFLDTFNVNAHTTASDALWAGVPLVTLAGRQFAARVGASLLHAVGLPELVTETEGYYEALALGLASEPDRLALVRSLLAANLRTRPLFDTARYAANIEAAFVAAHQRRIAGHAPATMSV